MNAILGTSDQCIATHPSDMCVAMAALDAIIQVEGKDGKRSIAFEDFYLLPGHTPDKENALQPGELITHVEIPALPFASHSTYLKVRDRSSYEFALTSAAVALDVTNGTINAARIALGGVGTKPWRATKAEQSLAGKTAGMDAYKAAADLALEGAVTHTYNAFKPELARRTIISASTKFRKYYMKDILGQPVDRKEGKLKVTGSATFAAEFPVRSIAYGVTVQSTISKGFIDSFDTSAVLTMKGVIDVMTYKNAMRLQPLTPDKPVSGRFSEKQLLPLQTNEIFYNGQHIAVVIAETLEIAQYAASLLKINYTVNKAITDIKQPEAVIYQPGQSNGKPTGTKHGDADKGMQGAAVTIDETYTTPVYHHNPMEPHSTVAIWNGDQLTVHDATQSVYGVKSLIASMLDMMPDKVRVISPFIGGGFGSKGFMWANSVMAPMAAKLINRPVKIVLERTGQMFSCAGQAIIHHTKDWAGCRYKWQVYCRKT